MRAFENVQVSVHDIESSLCRGTYFKYSCVKCDRRQAVEHLLIGLNQQVSGRGLHGEKSLAMSESIWTTLRLALALMDRKDLYPAAEKR